MRLVRVSPVGMLVVLAAGQSQPGALSSPADPSVACRDGFAMPSIDGAPDGDIKCRLVIVRHIVKCAGTTMRGVWERLSLSTLDWHTQSVYPAPTHYCFYGAGKRRREATDKYERCANGLLDKRVQAAVEYHVSTDMSTSLAADLARIRSIRRAPAHHRAVAVLIVREPRGWFASVYRYQLVYKFKKVDMRSYIEAAESPQLGHLLGGSGFVINASWASRHRKGLPEMHPHAGRFVQKGFPDLPRVLDAFDVVGVMAQFAQAVFLVCSRVGLPVCPHYARQWESAADKKAKGTKEVPPGPWPYYSDAEIAELHALIDDKARGDKRLYELARDRLERDLAGLEPVVRSACDAYAEMQKRLTAAKALEAAPVCRAVREWQVESGGQCRLRLTPTGEADARGTGIAPGSEVWDAE